MNVGQRQEDAGSRLAVAWLVNDLSNGAPLQLGQDFMAMITRHHGDDSFRVCDHGRAIHRMLEHGTGADEGAVLFGFVDPEPTAHERLHPGALAACENDGPAGRDWRYLVHSVPCLARPGWRGRIAGGRTRSPETCRLSH